MQTRHLLHLSCLFAMLGLARPGYAQTPAPLSEKDYLGDVPVVLSVSRLPQRLDETPGSVTILDRQMIRMSGARDVADLLRLVPGFRVSNSFEANTPQGSYHMGLGDYSNRMQVLVDGRSVYSVYMQGGTGPGLQTVALEDIERIEVHRGSNSAAYGARAFLGTINIVTRDTVDTQGIQAQVANGESGIQDSLVRLGWGNESGGYRITADRRADLGLAGAAGPARVHRLNIRGDVRASNVDTLEFRAGQAVIDVGVGFEGDTGNAPRTRTNTSSFIQLDWRRSLGLDADLAVQYSHTDERVKDDFPYTSLAGLTIDFGGRAASDNLSFQHTVRTGADVRLLWGGELRRESIVSRPLYNTDAEFVTDFARVFGNAEWRLHRDLLLNAGGMFERSNLGGEHVSPRAMLNWTLAPGHTLRYGLTQAFRPPSTYEKFSNVRYYLNGVLQDSTDVSRGNVAAEKIQAREIGYLADFPQFGLNVDVRIFEEDVRSVVKRKEYSLPGSGGNGKAYEYVNSEDFNAHGHEYQIRWQPWRGGQLFFSQTFVDSGQSLSGDFPTRPYASMALMVMQQLPHEASLALTYSQVDASIFPGQNVQSPAMSRTDLRLAKAVRLGKQRGEIAFVVQNLGPAYQDFRSDFYFRHQAYLMFRVEN
jgi:iron complex outermembrane receptor protein